MCRFAHVRGKNREKQHEGREKQHEGRGMIASLFTKIKSENRFIYYLFLQNNKR